MEIATEMSRLVLEMRGNDENRKIEQQRLELLAEHFLHITREGGGAGSTDDTSSGQLQGVPLPM